MNKSILFGRLVKDPDIRYTQTQSGELAIANFRIAVNRKYAKENGPNADFFTCTAFGKKAEYSIHLVIIVYSYLLFCYTPFKKQFWRIRNATLSCYTY